MQVGPMMGIMALSKEEERKINLPLSDSLSSLPECTHQGKAMWGPNKKAAIYKPGSGPSPNTVPAYTLILDLQHPELWEWIFVV